VTAGSFHAHAMAIERVEQRLRKVTAALDAAGVDYAVIGGNAVATWVTKADPSAARATVDVDLLARRSDLDRITAVFASLGFRREDLKSITLFVDPEEPSRRSGVHLVWAGEKVRPSYDEPAPDVSEAVRSEDGFRVLDLAPLVRMKLTSFRDKDRVHIADLLGVGLITDDIRDALPPLLRERLADVEASRDPDDF